MPTIYDIAKIAGVSPATVSKVFNNYTEVGQKTKDKVMAIAKEMNYVPNLSAQSLKTNKSFLVGVIFSEGVGIGLDHQFFSVVLESFRKEIGHYGYDTIFINNALGNKKMGYLEHCKYRNVDGAFIITAHPNDVDMDKLIMSKTVCVTTDIVYSHIPYVSSDNIAGGEMAVQHFYDQGHRKIALLSGPLNTLSAQERLIGYQNAHNNLGLIEDPRYFVACEWYNDVEAYQGMLELLERFESCPHDRPTGVFVGADFMALGAMRAIREKGLKIPHDISIVGFDDIPLAEHVRPALTTIRQNKEQIGCTVADVLYEFIKKGTYEVEVPRIPVTLVQRDSVRRLE